MRPETHAPTDHGGDQEKNGRIRKCDVPDRLLWRSLFLSNLLTLLTASRSLRPDMVLGAVREQGQPPGTQGAKAGSPGWTPPVIHGALAALPSIP